MALNASVEDYLPVRLELMTPTGGTWAVKLSCPSVLDEVEGPLDLSPIHSDLQYFYDRLRRVFTTSQFSKSGTRDGETDWQINLANRLIQAVLIGPHQSAFEVLVRAAHKRTIVLSIVMPASDLETYPWELIGHPASSYTRTTQSPLAVCRLIPTEAPSRFSPEPQAKILLATSQPLDNYALHAETEFDAIKQAIRFHIKEVKLIVLKKKRDYHSFINRLRKEQPAILHLAVHGTPAHLEFESTDEHQPIPYDSLIRDIRQVKSIRLIVLNVCYSASPSSVSGPIEVIYVPGLSRQLVENGIPAVIGMATIITERAAHEFSRALYSGLSEGKSVSVAYERAVDALRIYPRVDQLLWSVPMLYMSQDVAPLAAVIEALHAEVTRPPKWPIEFLEDVADKIKEFIEVFEDIQPVHSWRAQNWRSAVRLLRALLPDLEEFIQALPVELPKTYEPSMKNSILNICRQQRKVVEQLTIFKRRLEDLERHASPQAVGGQSIFMESGRGLVNELKALLASLQM